MQKIIAATRRSALALAQARAWLRSFESSCDVQTEELHVVTTGDRIQDRALSQIGGKGLFIKEIEEALLAGHADIAVHSMKDVPAELAPGLSIGCIPPREDARDVIKTRSGCRFEDLPKGAKVGTSSLRRVVQLKERRPDLEFLPLRGNVDTRLRKCEEGEVDAVVLAYAGLKRLGFEDRLTHVLEPELCLPAVGQGALAVEYRTGDTRIEALLALMNDPDSEVAVAAERGVMIAVEGGCQVPVGAYALKQGGELWLRAMLDEPDGSRRRFREARIPWPDRAGAFALGTRLGSELKPG
ncbi:MAG: porphobilinogen deaminase [Pseudomonadota bacterium]|jgi:hydroxymethylbilane synthase